MLLVKMESDYSSDDSLLLRKAKVKPEKPLKGEHWERIESTKENIPETSQKFELGSALKFSNLVDYFDFFFDQSLLQTIADLSNQNFKDSNKKGPSEELTVAELRRFLGLIIMMGIDKKPEVAMHWETHGMWDSNLIRSTMSRQRFSFIWKWLKIYPGESQNSLDKIHLINESIKLKSKEACYLGQNLAIDESMVAFKGRHQMKQYMPMKPTKWGFKYFVLADSGTGYAYNWELFSEKKCTNFSPYNIVLRLMEGLQKNHHLFTDNWYSSVKLAEQLYQRGFYMTGTMRKSQNAPQELKTLKLQKNEAVFWHNKEVLFLAWKDRKLVCAISNYYPPYIVERKKKSSEKTAERPLLIHEYNRYMQGVDLLDQRMSYYPYPHKSLKWWKYLFVFYLEVAINNSYLLYCKQHSKKTFVEYRLELVKSLTYRETIGNKRLRTPLTMEQKYAKKRLIMDTANHHTLLSTGKAQTCDICKYQGSRNSRTTLKCNECNKPMHRKCFFYTHSQAC